MFLSWGFTQGTTTLTSQGDLSQCNMIPSVYHKPRGTGIMMYFKRNLKLDIHDKFISVSYFKAIRQQDVGLLCNYHSPRMHSCHNLSFQLCSQQLISSLPKCLTVRTNALFILSAMFHTRKTTIITTFRSKNKSRQLFRVCQITYSSQKPNKQSVGSVASHHYLNVWFNLQRGMHYLF